MSKKPKLDLQLSGLSKRYPTIYQCIYCGKQNARLTDEHILPFAIAGNAIIFEKASCQACAGKFNNEFENLVLRQTLYPFRLKIGAPTRNKSARPKTINVLHSTDAERTSSFQIRSYSADDSPLGLVVLRLFPPKILFGGTASETDTFTAWSNIDTEKIALLYKKQAPVTVVVGQIDCMKFARFLAKIAYSYAIAELGTDGFSPLILPLLRGERRVFSDFVGGEYEIPSATEYLHELKHYLVSAGGKVYVCVKIRLFASYGAPTHHVVVGCLHNKT